MRDALPTISDTSATDCHDAPAAAIVDRRHSAVVDSVSILLCDAVEPRQLARCLRALFAQPLLLPDELRCEVLIADTAARPGLRRVLAAAARSAPPQLSLRPVAADPQRPLDALRRAARGRVCALLSAGQLPQPQWLREGLAALGPHTAAVAGFDDRVGTPQASTVLIRAEVLDAIAPGRFHASALLRSVAAWHGEDALREARRALSSRMPRRVTTSSPLRTAATAGMPASPPHPPIQSLAARLTHWATAAALGIAMTAGLVSLHGRTLPVQAHAAPARLQLPQQHLQAATWTLPATPTHRLVEI